MKLKLKCLSAICFLTLFVQIKAGAKDKVLVFIKTAGFHHNSIAAGVPAIMKMGRENNFDVDSTSDSNQFTADNLKQYKAIIFLNTSGNVFNDAQKAAFIQYIEAGGGYAGVHAASDTEFSWQWYGNLVGAYFSRHPKEQQTATLNVVDQDFIATKHLPAVWKKFDEWYNFKWIAADIRVLIKVDEKSYTGGENGDNHPISWYHTYDGGRSFYTALGHTDESYTDPLFYNHLLGGIKYAMGRAK